MEIEMPGEMPALKEVDGKPKIFCAARKKWLDATPEEWVRQIFIRYLAQSLSYPLSMIAVEKRLKLGPVYKRFDIAVYKNASPWMIVECKEQNATLSEKAFLQALHYNGKLRAPYLVITSGNETRAFILGENGYREMNEMPKY